MLSSSSGGDLIAQADLERESSKYVGLANQGSTCYLNALLQCFFYIKYFTDTIFKVPSLNDQLIYALQFTFYQLQGKVKTASTEELTRSFGWSQEDTACVQHDIQELNRILCDKLAEKMKGTEVEGTIDKLFCGTKVNYVRCLDTEYTSIRTEKFYDITLQVANMKGIESALNQYTQPELLEGENKYCVEKDGVKKYHTAEKGVYFKSLPPVLCLHLQRMEVDFEDMRHYKLNTKFEFPMTLDMSPYLAHPEWQQEEDTLKRQDTVDQIRTTSFRGLQNSRGTYSLQSVIVHSGTPYCGHYYAFVRPECRGQWYRFDDSIVTPASMQEAVHENFGGSSQLLFVTRCACLSTFALKAVWPSHMIVHGSTEWLTCSWIWSGPTAPVIFVLWLSFPGQARVDVHTCCHTVRVQRLKFKSKMSDSSIDFDLILPPNRGMSHGVGFHGNKTP